MSHQSVPQRFLYSSPTTTGHIDHAGAADDDIEAANGKGAQAQQLHDDDSPYSVEELEEQQQQKHPKQENDDTWSPPSSHDDAAMRRSIESKLDGRTTGLFLASDLSLVTGLERTFFAALNNVSLLVLTGAGLMMVGNGDETATGSGIAMLGKS